MNMYQMNHRNFVMNWFLRVLVVFCYALWLSGISTADEFKASWVNSNVAVLDTNDGKTKKVKVGPALVFEQATPFKNVVHGLEFVVAPGKAAQRSRLNVYKVSQLSEIWPKLRAAIKTKGVEQDGDIRTAILMEEKPGQFLGVPVKWNFAFATTMDGAYVGLENGIAPELPELVASSLLNEGIKAVTSVDPIKASDPENLFLITGSSRDDAWKFLSDYLQASKNQSSLESRPIFEMYLGLDQNIETILENYGDGVGITTVPNPITSVISSRQVDGKRLSGWEKWVVE